MHYSLKQILTAEELKYFIDYYDSHEHYVTQTMEKLSIPYDDSDFMSRINDLIKNKLASGRYKDLADIEQLIKNRE